MQWQWFNKDRLGVGFTLGILGILLGIVIAYLGLTNNSPFHVVAGSAWILVGLINNVVVIIYWLRKSRSETK